MGITHATVASGTDAGTGEIHKSQWNADHVGAPPPLEQHTASTSASLDFTTFISSTYDMYVFELIDIVTVTDNIGFFARVMTGAGPTVDTGSNYAYASFRNSNSGSAVAGSTTGSPGTSWGIDGGGQVDNGTGSGVCGWLRLFNPQSSTRKKVTWDVGYVDNAGAVINCVGTGVYTPTTVLTGFQFLFATGNNIASGTIRVYGIAK